GHVPAGATYPANILPALVLIGFGGGFSFVSVNTAALAQVQETVAGLASGLLSSAAQLGGAVGLAVIVALATTRTGALLRTGTAAVTAQTGGAPPGPPPPPPPAPPPPRVPALSPPTPQS